MKNAEVRRRSGPLRLTAVANTMQGARLGMIVGKRAVGRAHERNRMKRVIRDEFRRRHAELADVDMVILVMAELGNRELRAHLSRLFESEVQR